MDTSKHSAYSTLSDKMVRFLDYNPSSIDIWNKTIINFFKLSISLCKPIESGYGYNTLHASQEVHLAYLKKYFPEAYFLAVYYLHLNDCRHKGQTITEEQLDDLCYDAFVSLSNRISALSNKHELICSARLMNIWLLVFETYIIKFITVWWSDIAEMVYGENVSVGVGETYETEFPRLERVSKRLIKNNIPFMSVLFNSILRSGIYGNHSGVYRILCVDGDNFKYRVEKNNSGNLGELEPYARILCNSITQEYMDSELVVSILWLYRVSNLINYDEYNTDIVYWISIEPMLFFYKNSKLKCFNNINDELIESVKNNDTSMNFIDVFVHMAVDAYDFLKEDSIVKVEAPESLNKYMNYMKLKRKVRY